MSIIIKTYIINYPVEANTCKYCKFSKIDTSFRDGCLKCNVYNVYVDRTGHCIDFQPFRPEVKTNFISTDEYIAKAQELLKGASESLQDYCQRLNRDADLNSALAFEINNFLANTLPVKERD
jgi:hypothetical protein